jgi:hypothetical protein
MRRTFAWAAIAVLSSLSPALAWQFTPSQIDQYDEGDRQYCAYQAEMRWAADYQNDPPHIRVMAECLEDVANGPRVGPGPTIVPLREVLRDSKEILAEEARKGWVTDGQSDLRVPTLRKRLSVRDKPWYANDFVFKEDVSDALKKYQEFHGLPANGRLDELTLAELDRNARGASAPEDWQDDWPEDLPADPPAAKAPPAPDPVETRPAEPRSHARSRPAPSPRADAPELQRPQPPPAAPERHTASAPGAVDLHSLSLFLFALAILFTAVRGRPAIEWVLGVGGPFASAARSPRVGSFFRQAWYALNRLYARLKGSPAVPKAVGAAGGLIAYFFSEPRRLAAWGFVLASACAFLLGLISGILPFAFGGYVLMLGCFAGADYHFSVIQGQPRALAYKLLLGRTAFKLIPAFFGTLLLFGFLALGSPVQQGAGVLCMLIGLAIAVCYFASLGAFRVAAWRSYCEYGKMHASGGNGFTSIDIAQRILSQLPPTSLDVEPVIEALIEQLAGGIPEPPDSLFDVHAHYAYLRSLKALSFATPEAEDLFVELVVAALMTIVPKFPEPAGAPLFTTRMEDPLGAVIEFMERLIHPRAVQLRVLETLRSTFNRNVAEMQARKSSLTIDAAVKLALKDTPLLGLFTGRLPYELQIAKKIWFMHVHICAATGAFKTQLAQTLILHLVTLFGEPSFMVVDSQGPMLDLLHRKFGSRLGGSMLRIHPHSSPVGINPFDVDFSGMSDAEKGSAITGVADLFVGLFATGSSELSDKMRTLFDQVVRLFLIGIPAVQKRTATMRDLDDFMDCAQPWIKYKAEIECLDDRGRVFFGKHSISAYADTRSQVHQRLYSLLRDPAIEKMLCAERNELDLDRYLNQPGMVLVDTASGTIGLQNSAFLGRLFILLAQRALLRREPIPAGDPHPAFIVADEAQEYFKAHEVLEQFIDQGRKRNFGLIAIHHRFGQAPGPLQDAFEQVGVHFASEVAPSDCARLAGIMRTSVTFLQSQLSEQVPPGQDPGWVDYALYFRGLRTAISVRLAYGNLENFDTSDTYRGARAHNAGGQQQRKRSGNQQSGPKQSGSRSKPRAMGPHDIEIEIAGNPAKMKKGGKQSFQYDGKRYELDIPPGTAPRVRSKDGKTIVEEGDAFPIKGALLSGGTLWVVLTKHPDINDDMDTGASPWP